MHAVGVDEADPDGVLLAVGVDDALEIVVAVPVPSDWGVLVGMPVAV